jgi:hypothetical protein
MKSLAISALLLAALSANAQTVYRCGSAYSQEPCPQAQRIDVTDSRTDSQRAEARQAAADEQRLGTRMEHERLALQTSYKPAGAGNLGAAPPRAPLKTAERHPAKKVKWIKLKPAKKLERAA